MLACAHVLAMDAKNLLDVVDSIRVRYPDLVLPAHLQPQPQSSSTSPVSNAVTSFQFGGGVSTPGSGSIGSPHSSVSITTSVVTSASTNVTTTNNSIGYPPSSTQMVQRIVTQTTFVQPNENQYQNQTPHDCYQNVGPNKLLAHTTTPPSSLTHSFTDTVTSTSSSNAGIPTASTLVQQQQQQIYSNQSGIYDNESAMNQQIKNLELTKAAPKKEVIKPPPPIRSSGLVSKMRANFQQQAADAATKSNGAKDPLNEPLKIVEDDLYSNTAGGIQLPEPVSCTVVTENLLANNQQKAVSK